MNPTTTLPIPEAHFITLSKAIEMLSRFDQNHETILAAAYKEQNILPFSETFNRNAFDVLLAEEGCAGLRIYYSMDESFRLHVIIVAVNDQNEDILPSGQSLGATTVDPKIVEEGQRCPDLCPPKSNLNT